MPAKRKFDEARHARAHGTLTGDVSRVRGLVAGLAAEPGDSAPDRLRIALKRAGALYHLRRRGFVVVVRRAFGPVPCSPVLARGVGVLHPFRVFAQGLVFSCSDRAICHSDNILR